MGGDGCYHWRTQELDIWTFARVIQAIHVGIESVRLRSPRSG
jgi:hypothetical protein